MILRLWCAWRHRSKWQSHPVVSETHDAYVCTQCGELWVWPRA